MDVDLDAVLAALADRSRRALLQRLAYGQATTGQLAELLPVSRPAVSQHLKVLQDAGLVRTEIRGRHRWHRLAVEPLAALARWTSELTTRAAAAPVFAQPPNEPLPPNAQETP